MGKREITGRLRAGYARPLQLCLAVRRGGALLLSLIHILDDATQTVHIVRFLYGKSNWITILKTGATNGSLPVFS